MQDEDFMRNELLRHQDGSRHRLLAFDVDDDVAWLIAMEEEFAVPYSHPYSELRSVFDRIEPENDKPAAPKSFLPAPTLTTVARPPTKAAIALSERSIARIEPLLEKPGLFDPSERNRLLTERSQEPGRNGTPKTLLKHLRAYWKGGQTQDALLGDLDKCGHPHAEGTARRGRKRADKSLPYQLHASDYDAMKDVIETFYFNNEKRHPLTAALQELHERHYTYLDGNNVLCLRPADEAPSYRQFERFLKQNYSLETRMRARLGDKQFDKDHRARTGSVQIDCHGVGHIYEFDATIADVSLVSSSDRAAIVGKPTLYLIIDRASRLIVGWYVGFENAAYTTAMEAILSIGADKEVLCEDLGIDYDPADWPAHGILPESFIADQGELTSKTARRIARSLRCMLTNVPGLRPDWKPLVECGFAMLHQIIAPHTPAYSPDSDNRQRRAIKHDKYSSLNLKQFTAVIVKAIIAHNRTMQVGYPLTISQVADGAPPIPLRLWEQGVRRRMGKLDRMDFDKVRAELMPRGKATITGDGIVFNDIYYSCPDAEVRGWLVSGRRSRKPLEVAFDYRLVDEILVFSPNGSGESFVASLSKDSVMFRGMAFADVARHKFDEAQLKAPAPEVKRQNRFGFNQFAKKVAAQGNALTKEAAKGVSYAARKKAGPAEREAELSAERERLGGVRTPAAQDAAQAPVASPKATAPLEPGALAPVIKLKQGKAKAAEPNPQAKPATVTPMPNAAPSSTAGQDELPSASPTGAHSSAPATNSPRPMSLAERMAAARKLMED